MAAQGEVMFGVKVYEAEAEIKEALEPILSTSVLSGRNTSAQGHLQIQDEPLACAKRSSLPSFYPGWAIYDLKARQ